MDPVYLFATAFDFTFIIIPIARYAGVVKISPLPIIYNPCTVLIIMSSCRFLSKYTKYAE